MNILEQINKTCTSYYDEANSNFDVNLGAFGVTDGYSGKRILGLLQALGGVLTENNTGCYAEVGVFKGLTLTSVALSNPTLKCYGCDNFSQFNAGGGNKGIVESALGKLKLSNAELLDGDFEQVIPHFNQYSDSKIGVYFFDGPHDYRSQLMGLIMALPHLSDNAVIIIDDANYGHVQQATADFLFAYSEFKLLVEVYTPDHPMAYANTDTFKLFTDSWWNGIHVLVRDPEDRISRISPHVFSGTRQYLMDEHPGAGGDIKSSVTGAVNRMASLY